MALACLEPSDEAAPPASLSAALPRLDAERAARAAAEALAAQQAAELLALRRELEAARGHSVSLEAANSRCAAS